MAELKARGFEASDISGRKSQFDVVADGLLVFSKEQAGRFPELDEILAVLPRSV